MAKIIYIIPGFGENTKLKRYHGIITFLKERGFNVVSVNITWKYKVMSDYVKEFQVQCKQHNEKDDVYLFGFSYGAMISFLASPGINPKAQFLCSLSPYFKEDLPSLKKWWKKFVGANRIKEFELLSFNDLVKQITCKTYIFAGAEEGSEVEIRAKSANKQLKNNELFMINGGKHDISQKVYFDKLKEVISKI